jgi:hypothetical protein
LNMVIAFEAGCSFWIFAQVATYESVRTDGGSNPCPAPASDEGRARWRILKKTL